MITKAIVLRMHGNKCIVRIPSMSNSEVEAAICSPKGFNIIYEENDIVYVSLVDNITWVVLGVLNLDEYGMHQLTLDSARISTGFLGDTVALSDSNLTIKDLINMYRNFSDFLNNYKTGEDK